MDLAVLFRDLDLTPADQVCFARVFQICLRLHGADRCWSLQRNGHQAFAGFTTSSRSTLTYRGVEARALILGMSGRFQQPNEVAIRRGCCTSPHCLNPSHYYWGTRSQVSLERGKAPKAGRLAPDVIQALREGRQQGKRVLDLARQYKVPYHTARRICAGETYENISEIKEETFDAAFWLKTMEICKAVTARYPEEAREYKLAIHVSNQLECPWHRQGGSTHKGNFGLMGECLDCLEEIKKGRCTVDVTEFDMTWYWQVKRFWEQVDIRGKDECWPWLGPTRRQGYESLAYFPSPFHSGKTQSASRVAFWLSRGYTGKYRVFTKPECDKFCCNPKHLTIREIIGSFEPNDIAEIRLNHGNIFNHYRTSNSKNEPSAAD